MVPITLYKNFYHLIGVGKNDVAILSWSKGAFGSNLAEKIQLKANRMSS